jgi:hypothetical protein
LTTREVPAELIEQLIYEGAYSVYIGYDGEKTEYRIVTAEDLWEANEALNEYLKTIYKPNKTSKIMKKFELIWKVVLIVLLITSTVLFILDGNLLAAWVVNAVLWCFMMWEMFNVICDKLDAIAMGVHAILFGKVEEIITAMKADDEPKAETDQE